MSIFIVKTETIWYGFKYSNKPQYIDKYVYN